MPNSDSDSTRPVTRLLGQIQSGRTELRPNLMELVYDELRRIADACFRSQPASHTLQPTALVHEVFHKLFASDPIEAGGRAEFFAIAARAMRQILIDHARAKVRLKRGGAERRRDVEIDELFPSDRGPDLEDVLDLDRVLRELASRDARQAKIVELRFFAGLEMSEAADCLGVSLSTVEREWRAARAWLGQRLAAS